MRMLLCALLLSLVSLGSVFGQDKYIPKLIEELYGTWTNRSSVQDIWHPQKLIVARDGITRFVTMADSVPYGKSTVVVYSKWADARGAVYYKYYTTWTYGCYKGQRFQVLVRISGSGTVSESVSRMVGLDPFDPRRIPKKVDQKDPTYEVRYRVMD